jgi:hypothetical protein
VHAQPFQPSLPLLAPDAIRAPPFVPSAPTTPPTAQERPPEPTPLPIPLPPRPQPAATLTPPSANPLAVLMPALFPAEVPRPPEPTQQPVPAPREPLQASQPASSPPAQADGSAQVEQDHRAAQLTAFYSAGLSSADWQQQISKTLHIRPASAGNTSQAAAQQHAADSGLAIASHTPAAANQPAAATVRETSAAAYTGTLPALQLHVQQGTLPLPKPAAEPTIRPLVRLSTLGRPPYAPHLTPALRPYKPPLVPNPPGPPASAPRAAPFTTSTSAVSQPPAPAGQTLSYTDMLLSTIRGDQPQGPAAPPVGSAPRADQDPAPAVDKPGMTRSNSATSSMSEAASADAGAAPDTYRKKGTCTLCHATKPNYVALPCRHWGPCQGCTAAAEEISLYPVCHRCNAKVESLLRVFES